MENAERDYPTRRPGEWDRLWERTPTRKRRSMRATARGCSYWLGSHIISSEEDKRDHCEEMWAYWRIRLHGYSHSPEEIENIRKIIKSYDPECQ